MRIAVVGPLGSGKTLFMTAIGKLMSLLFGVPLAANYEIKGVKNFKLIKTLQDLWDFQGGVILLDEFWESFDSRSPGSNVVMSRWINQTRKRHIVVFYTTQSMDQVDKRLRRVTDIVVMCRKQKDGIKATFIDNYSLQVLRSFKIREPQNFYDDYDTDNVVDVLAGFAGQAR